MAKLGAFTLGVMFIVILGITTTMLISGYYNLQNTNQAVEKTLANVESRIRSIPDSLHGSCPAGMNGGAKRELLPLEKTFILQLKSASKGTLDSSAISFLMQILCLSLVSAGVYLFAQSQKHLTTANEKAESLRKTIEVGFWAQELSTALSSAYVCSVLLRSSPNQPTIDIAWSAFILLRDRFRCAADTLPDVKLRVRDSLLDQATRIRSEMSDIPNSESEIHVHNSINSMMEIIEICVSTIEDANRQTEALPYGIMNMA